MSQNILQRPRRILAVRFTIREAIAMREQLGFRLK